MEIKQRDYIISEGFNKLFSIENLEDIKTKYIQVNLFLNNSIILIRFVRKQDDERVVKWMFDEII